MTAQTPPRSDPAAEGVGALREALAEWIAHEMFDEFTGPQHEQAAKGILAGPLAPLLADIAALRTRAEIERSNRKQWAAQAHEFAVAADRLAGEKDAAEAAAAALRTERDEARAALQAEWDAIDLALTEGCRSDSPRAALVADWIGRCAASDARADEAERDRSTAEAERDALAAEVAGLKRALADLLPGKLCGESWGTPDAERVSISVTFGALKAARRALRQPEGGTHDAS